MGKSSSFSVSFNLEAILGRFEGFFPLLGNSKIHGFWYYSFILIHKFVMIENNKFMN